MITSTHRHNITTVKFDKEIYYSKDVKYFTDIPEVSPIPANAIIYKTVTGIGATHSEIVADRHSIIVLPHIAIIKSKEAYYHSEGINVFAIHGEITQEHIMDYLSTCIGDMKLKFLVTPKGLIKLIKRFKNCSYHDAPVPYTEMFFLLIDECHKLVQDAAYRSDMLELMDQFFDFTGKAMVSATPIPPSDPRFQEKGFKHIKVCPDSAYKQQIEVLSTGSLVNTLNDYLDNNSSACYCIFFNSVEGIKSLIRQLKIADDYLIYCSKESSELLKLNEERNVSSELGNFKRFNFFTSSFFNGLDFFLETKPDVLILTDYGYRDHTLLDPYTDILQIMGRFRRSEEQKKRGEFAYNKVIHINNSRHFTNPKSQQEAHLTIQYSQLFYNHLLTLKQSTYDNTFDELLIQQLKTVKPYSRLIKKNGELSHFLKDNYLDDERIKTYYKSPSALLNAYVDTNLYQVKPLPQKIYEKDELIRLQKKSIRYSKAMNKLMANNLLELEDYKGMEIYYDQRAIIEKLSPLIYDAYNRLGYAKIAEHKFKGKPIQIELLKNDIDQKLNYFPLINMIYQAFRLNTKYTVGEVKSRLITIFEEFEIAYRAKSTDVFRYFEYKETKKDGERAYVFTAQKLYPIQGRQHI